jgi:hypothetical protein
MAVPINNLMQSLEKIKTRSITDPPFIISGFLFLMTVVLICTKSAYVFIFIFLSLAIIAFGVGLYVYLYFVRKNPDYIRSEHYQLQKQQLTMLGDSNNKGNANMNLLPIVKPGENLADDKIIEQ